MKSQNQVGKCIIKSLIYFDSPLFLLFLFIFINTADSAEELINYEDQSGKQHKLAFVRCPKGELIQVEEFLRKDTSDVKSFLIAKEELSIAHYSRLVEKSKEDDYPSWELPSVEELLTRYVELRGPSDKKKKQSFRKAVYDKYGMNQGSFQSQLPVFGISFEEAEHICRVLQNASMKKHSSANSFFARAVKLPTDAQWQYAVRAADPGNQEFNLHFPSWPTVRKVEDYTSEEDIRDEIRNDADSAYTFIMSDDLKLPADDQILPFDISTSINIIGALKKAERLEIDIETELKRSSTIREIVADAIQAGETSIQYKGMQVDLNGQVRIMNDEEVREIEIAGLKIRVYKDKRTDEVTVEVYDQTVVYGDHKIKINQDTKFSLQKYKHVLIYRLLDILRCTANEPDQVPLAFGLRPAEKLGNSRTYQKILENEDELKLLRAVNDENVTIKNNWGLIHSLGNVREWAVSPDGEPLVAGGGVFDQSVNWKRALIWHMDKNFVPGEEFAGLRPVIQKSFKIREYREILVQLMNEASGSSNRFKIYDETKTALEDAKYYVDPSDYQSTISPVFQYTIAYIDPGLGEESRLKRGVTAKKIAAENLLSIRSGDKFQDEYYDFINQLSFLEIAGATE